MTASSSHLNLGSFLLGASGSVRAKVYSLLDSHPSHSIAVGRFCTCTYTRNKALCSCDYTGLKSSKIKWCMSIAKICHSGAHPTALLTCVGVSTFPSWSISTESYLTVRGCEGFSSTSGSPRGPVHWLKSMGIFNCRRCWQKRN